MKRHLYLLTIMFFCSISLTLNSCGKSCVDESLEIVDEAIENINKANDVYELIGIANKLKADLNEINAANKDYKPTKEESTRIKEKLNELMRVYMKRNVELNLGNTEYGEQSQKIIDKMLPRN